ncbi:hypothetical protein P154DRAFT_622555 [Amniculicola lignicola CBS 123094]|uniref:Uncharacterized protein n=1 Tax=Amniculicola lignicola CBS 123094 TaxID=1392246 RepID=A0A6A5WDP4_9PLEO|nr:hypothetical protein P154DRAFT_622555 [Amniculicola lignicola CBS 123094]
MRISPEQGMAPSRVFPARVALGYPGVHAYIFRHLLTALCSHVITTTKAIRQPKPTTSISEPWPNHHQPPAATAATLAPACRKQYLEAQQPRAQALPAANSGRKQEMLPAFLRFELTRPMPSPVGTVQDGRSHPPSGQASTSSGNIRGRCLTTPSTRSACGTLHRLGWG